MIRTERGDRTRLRRLIEARDVETDGERLHWGRAQLDHGGDHGRRIDAAGQECAQWHVSDHLSANSLMEKSVELRKRLGLVDAEPRAGRERNGIPVSPDVRSLAPDAHGVSGCKLRASW